VVALTASIDEPSAGRHLTRVDIGEDLTPREIEVLRQVALGLSNRDIGAVLGIGEETVKTHVGHVLSKLQVENRAQATVQALKRGLVALEDLT
jgi:DNA-binding NarL/FixJ family response regulator